MSSAFILTPDFQIADNYGYFNLNELQASVKLLSGKRVSVEIEHIWTEEKREAIEIGFRALVNQYNISDHYDTLLYICLIESNHADIVFQQTYNTWEKNKRIKGIAQLLLLYKPTSKHKPYYIKVSSPTDEIKLTDSTLIEWIGGVISKAITEFNFIPTELGEELTYFTADQENKVFIEGASLNYPIIESFAKRVIRKPGIRERNKSLATFLLRVLIFISNETTLTTAEGIRFSDDQLNFLFKVAELFEWIREIDFDSEPKDYMYTLLINRLKVQ